MPSPPRGCSQCGTPAALDRVTILTAHGHRITQHLDNREERRLGAHHPLTDLCLLCLFREELAYSRGVESALGSAPDSGELWGVQCFPGRGYGEEWADYSLLAFGKALREDSCRAPLLLFEGSDLAVHVWLWRVRYKDTPLYLEQRWNPAMPGPRRALLGLEDDGAPRHRLAALRGEQLLAKIEQPGWARFDDPAECKAAVETWILNALRQERKPRREDAEFELCFIRNGGRQLARYLEPAYKWSDLVREVKRSHPDLLS